MKRYVGIFEIMNHHIFSKLIVSSLCMCAIQWFTYVYMNYSNRDAILSFNGYFNHFLFGSTFLLTVIYICYCCSALFHKGSNTRYTMLRLGLSGKEIYICICIHTFCCLIVVWAIQILAVSGMFYHYVMNSQTDTISLFLSTHSSYFLGLVLPSVNLIMWFRIMGNIIVLSFFVSYYVCKSLINVKSVMIIWVCFLMFASLAISSLYFNGFIFIVSIICAYGYYKTGSVYEV